MENKNKRPVYLNLFKIRLPIGGFVSIVHRVTGVLLVLMLPLGLYFFRLSLQDEQHFNHLRTWLSSASGRISLGIFAWLFAQHFFSGLRHLLLDIDVGVEKTAARTGAWLTILLSILSVAVLEAVWIS